MSGYQDSVTSAEGGRGKSSLYDGLSGLCKGGGGGGGGGRGLILPWGYSWETSSPFLCTSSGDIASGESVGWPVSLLASGFSLLSDDVEFSRRTFGKEGGGGGVVCWFPWLLKDCREGGAGSRTRAVLPFVCLAPSSSLILSRFRNFSFSTKKDLGPECGVCAARDGENGVGGEVGDTA